jgi:hypothetical protein
VSESLSVGEKRRRPGAGAGVEEEKEIGLDHTADAAGSLAAHLFFVYSCAGRNTSVAARNRETPLVEMRFIVDG